jgi:VanZ family protein
MQPSQHFRPEQPSGFPYLALYLTIAYTFLLVYGTLFPLSGWRAPEISPWALMLQHGLQNTSKPDILTNLLVYMPFGLLLMRTIDNRCSSVHKILLATLASALLSLALEYLQTHLPGRVPSVFDLVLNTLGGFIGALFALAFRPETAVGGKLYRIRSMYIHPGPLPNLGLLAMGIWVLSQLSPLVPSIDLGNLRHGLKPLWHTLQSPATLEWILVVEYSLSITAAGIISSTLLRSRYNALFIFTSFVSLVLLLKIPVLGRQLSLEALLGLATGLVLTALIYERPLRLRLMIAAIAIVGMVLASGLYVPANAIADYPTPFNWIPFRSHLSNNVTGLIDILGGLWPFVAMNYLAWVANIKHRVILILTGTAAIFLLMFALEWYQQYLPGRSPGITDVIIAIIAWLLPWFYPALSRKETAEKTAATKRNPTGRVLPRYALPVIAALILVVIAGINWRPAGTLVERPLDESKLPVLPAPEDLPPVTLPDFRYSHPRLPAPTFEDIARLQQENPAWLDRQKKRAADGKGEFHAAFVSAYIEPGSVNLDILYQRLIALEISWRGHAQAKPVAVAYDWLKNSACHPTMYISTTAPFRPWSPLPLRSTLMTSVVNSSCATPMTTGKTACCRSGDRSWAAMVAGTKAASTSVLASGRRSIRCLPCGARLPARTCLCQNPEYTASWISSSTGHARMVPISAGGMAPSLLARYRTASLWPSNTGMQRLTA